MQPRNAFKTLKIRKFQSSEILHTRQCTHMLLNKAKVLILADGRSVTIHVPFNLIRFRLLPFDFNYFNSIMQNINDF